MLAWLLAWLLGSGGAGLRGRGQGELSSRVSVRVSLVSPALRCDEPGILDTDRLDPSLSTKQDGNPMQNGSNRSGCQSICQPTDSDGRPRRESDPTQMWNQTQTQTQTPFRCSKEACCCVLRYCVLPRASRPVSDIEVRAALRCYAMLCDALLPQPPLQRVSILCFAGLRACWLWSGVCGLALQLQRNAPAPLVGLVLLFGTGVRGSNSTTPILGGRIWACETRRDGG
ncbi:hypothetical protein N431DRAFT_139860 [Stipitochalara longipes BDJ]|nr:hypothetical protein N431DRAFT_139860 [Stipitochalara longipes BDJ]